MTDKSFVRFIMQRSYLLMLLPALVLYLIFIIYPFISSIAFSFYNWDGIGPMKWAGLQNYKTWMFRDPFAGLFYHAIWHNLYYFAMHLIAAVGLGLVFAHLLTKPVRGRDFYKAVFFLPHTISSVVVAFLWGLLLNPQFGAVNFALKSIGLEKLALPWLGDAHLALPTIVAIGIWHGLGFPILVLLAALIGVPKEVIEAAHVDGANGAQVFWRIIFPFVLPTTITLSVLIFLGSFGAFDLIYLLEGAEAGPFYSTDVLGTLFYRTAFGGMGSMGTGMGLGAALAVVMLIIILPVSLVSVWLQRRTQVEQ